MKISEIDITKPILFLGPFIIVPYINNISSLPQGLFLNLSVIFIAGVWCINCFQKGSFTFKKNKLFLPVGLWISWIIASIFWATNRYESILIAKQWLTGGILFFIISCARRDNTKTILPFLYWSGFGVAIIGLCQSLFDFQWIPQNQPPASTFTHKNVAIHYIMMTLPVGISLFLDTQKRWKNFCYGFSLVFILLYIFLTYTRAAWVVLFLMIIIWGCLLLYDYIKSGITPIWYPGKSTPVLIGIIFSLILLNSFGKSKNLSSAIEHMAGATESVFTQLSNNINHQSQTQIKDNSFTGRIEVWINSFEIVKQFPLKGVGIGNYRQIFQKYQNKRVISSWTCSKYRVHKAHNDHIQFLVELGIIGIGIWIFLLWRILKTFIQLFKQDLPVTSRYLLCCPFISIVNLLINANFSFPFQMAIPPVYFMVYIGILCSWTENNASTIEIKITKKAAYAFCLISVIFFILVGKASYAFIQADKHFLKMKIAERKNNWHEVINEGKKVLTYNPFIQIVYSSIGRGQIELGYPEKAIVSFEKVPFHINSIANKGVAYIKLNQLDQAEKYFKQALKYLPNLFSIRIKLIEIYMLQNRNIKIINHELDMIKKFHPKSIEVLLDLAIINIIISKPSEVISNFYTIRYFQPDDTIENIHNALISLNDGNIADAEKFYSKIDFKRINKHQLVFIVGKLALELNKQETLNYFINKMTKNSYFSSNFFKLGNLYFSQKKFKTAMNAFKLVIHLEPSHGLAHNNLGNIFKNFEMNEKAFEEYKAARTYEPNNPIIQFNTGLMAIQLSDYKIAEQSLKKAIQLRPSWALPYIKLAFLQYEQLKHYEEAAYHFSKGLSLNPKMKNHKDIKKLLLHIINNILSKSK